MRPYRHLGMAFALAAMILLGVFSATADTGVDGASRHAAATEYHVDANLGADAPGCGTVGSPCQTLSYVRPWLVGGDTVTLYDGDYGAILEGVGPTDVFTDWVTIQAATGVTPTVDSVSLGQNGSRYLGENHTGTFDAYVRFEGLHVLDGVEIYGARHVVIEGCLIEKVGPWTGSEENIEKDAVYIRGGTDIEVRDCEITRTATGIGARAHQVRLIGNHIHHITHDGIRSMGLWDSLVEGNRIHNLDDGVDDDDGYDWNRHCDAIHVFIMGSSVRENLMPNQNVTFRGNIIYDVESQGVQFNNYYLFPDVRNNTILFENNVFGPTRANVFNQADPVNGLIFRHNTIVHFPGGHQFTSMFRTVQSDNHTFRISSSPNIQVYNNILVNTAGSEYAEVFDWNLLQASSSGTAYSRFTIMTDTLQFQDPGAFDGRLLPTSSAINAGTRLFAPTPIYEYDREGTARDARPDMGAYELPGQTPDPEEPLPSYPGAVKVYVDDFEDADFELDPWLEAEGQQGLSWRQVSGDDGEYALDQDGKLDRNYVRGPLQVGSAWLFSEQGADWDDYKLSFDAFNAYVTIGDGPLLLAQDEQNGYWLDISRDNGRLVRLMTNSVGQPTTSVLATNAAIEMPHEGEQHYEIDVQHGEGAITFTVDVGGDGTAELTYTDDDPQAVARFATGGIGFHRDYTGQYHRIMYDNIRVELGSVGDLVLQATPTNEGARLAWTVMITLPVTTTWQIDYYSDTLPSLVLTETNSLIATRAYTLTGLVNYEWYTVTLHAMVDSTSFLSDTVAVMPTDIFVYLPLVAREE